MTATWGSTSPSTWEPRAGNLLVRAIASGELGSLEELRGVVRRSHEILRYEPGDHDRGLWDSAATLFASDSTIEGERVH